MVYYTAKVQLNILICKRTIGILATKVISSMEKNGDLESKEMLKAYTEESFQKAAELARDVWKTKMEISLMEYSKKAS